MNYIIYFISFFVLIIADSNFQIENDVIIINDSTFDLAVKKYEYLMVFFYAPWCIRCKKFNSEYEKAAKILKNENLYLSKVDATTEKKLVKKFDIKRFPVIKLFIKGKSIDYYGERKEENIINWIRRKTNGPAIILLNTENEINEFIEKYDVSIIYFGDNKLDIENYIKVARKEEDYQFGIVKDIKLIKKYSKERNIILYKKFDERKRELSSNINEKIIEEFIDKYSYPKIMKYNEKVAKLIFKKKYPALILYTENLEKWTNFTILTKNIQNENLKIIISNLKDGLSIQHSELIGIKENELPSIRIIDPRGKNLKKYKMNDDITEKNIFNFVNNWKNGKLKSYVKSQEIPKNNNGYVYNIVGKTFEKEVINNDKDVIILFYSPWCFNCKSVIPKYEEMAKILKNNKKLLVSKINAIDNEVESINIMEFPTIKFYPGNKKDKIPINYNGDKSVNDMIKFIKENSYNKIINNISNETKSDEDL